MAVLADITTGIVLVITAETPPPQPKRGPVQAGLFLFDLHVILFAPSPWFPSSLVSLAPGMTFASSSASEHRKSGTAADVVA
jgi:hypothetical protein